MNVIINLGDYGKIDVGLNIIYNGRKDSQVKIHGQRIELNEIENVIRNIKEVIEASVIIRNEKDNNKLVAFIVRKKNNLSDNKIKEILKEKLPIYMIPSTIVFISEMLYTPNGKIDKKSMLNFMENEKNENVYNKILTTTEEKIINNILNISNKKLQIDESFFNAGLDSFDIIRLSSTLSNLFNIDISIREIVKSDNIFELSKIIDSKEKNTKINVKKENTDVSVLTRSQKNIFYNYIKDTNSILYNTPCEITFNKAIDVKQLHKALNMVLNYHQAFKCNILIENGDPYLKYNKDSKIDIDIINSTYEQYKIIKDNFIIPFDLISDILVRIKIIIENKNIHILFDAHHIILDGTSIALLIKEIQQVYNRKETLIGSDQYMTYQALLLSENIFSSYSDILPTQIESDYKLIIDDNSYGERIHKSIDYNLMNEIKNFANRNNITVNSICMSALIITLSKYTYENQINIGTAITTRNTANHNMVGMFVNTIPFISNIDVNDSTLKFVKNINNNIFEIINNNEILDKNIEDNNSFIENFSIVYTYQNPNNSEIVLENHKATIEYLYRNTAKFDITFEILPRNNNMDIIVEYNANKYRYDKIYKLQLHYINCIKQIINSKMLKDIDIVDEEEKKKVLSINNNLKKCKYLSIQQLFQSIVNSNSKKLAVVYKEQNLTYEKLDLYSNNLAKLLKSNGINYGDTVAIIMDKSLEFIICVFAIIKAGGVYLPIDTNIPQERLKYMLDNSKTNIILLKNGLDGIFENKKNKYQVINVSIDNLNNDIYIYENIKGNIKDDCYIMYTSGSTGHPKGVVIRQEGIIGLVKDINYMSISKNDKVALSGTISFDASVFEMWLALLNGLTLYIIDKENLLQQSLFEKYINYNNINIMLLTTALFNSFVTYKPEMFKNVKYLLTGGDVFSYKSGNMLLRKNKKINLINAYGPTESTVITTTYNYKQIHESDVPIGKPINNTNCYAVDIFNNIAPIGAIAELLIGGPRIMIRYKNNEEETNKNLMYYNLEKGMVYRTGDLVKLNDDLQFIFKRRKDTQIKINGYRIEVNEIITRLLEIEGIKEVEIIVNKKTNNKITAYIIADNGITENEILSKISTKLPFYMIPSNIVMLDNMPMTVQGKVDRKLLSNMNFKKENKVIIARTKEEKALVNIWKKILNKNNIGINENFFDIGGDSILATQFTMECNKERLSYTYKDIYNYPTIEKLLKKSSELIDEKYNITKFNYNKLLSNIKKYKHRNNRINAKNILITGATGFLGAHVLGNFIDNFDGIAYCLVRQKDTDSKERLLNKMHYFFNNKYDKYFDSRIIVINGDLILNKLGMEESLYNNIIGKIDAIINCAAYVNHFGNLDKFIELNTNTVSNLINICLEYNKELYHISTLSVSGNMLESGQIEQKIAFDKTFDENDLFFGQKLNNPYVYSKYLAELKIIEYLAKGLRATIIRTGNLTGRYFDGKFQPNVEQNAFANRIKAFSYMKLIPNSLLDFNIEFTPVDYAADAICKSVFVNLEKMLIMHVYNDNYIDIKNVLKALEINKINIKVINTQDFNKILKEHILKKDPNIDGIIIDINEKDDIKYTTNITISSDKTKKYLRLSKFTWPKIKIDYLVKYFGDLINLGFLERGENNND